MDQARAMLDALMGPQRDVAKKSKKDPAEDWRDDSVCKSFLAGFCPFDQDVLGGTRNIKACPKIHSTVIRECFDKHLEGAQDSNLRYSFEAQALKDCEDVLLRAEEHSAKEVERLRSELRSTKPKLPPEILAKLEELRAEAADIERRAALLMKDAKQGGGYKNLSLTWSRAAKEKLEEAEELERAEQKRIADSIEPKSCDICGTVFLDDAKFQAHFHFDVHEGYKQVRDRHAQLEARQKQRSTQTKERSKEPSRSRQDGRERYVAEERERRSYSTDKPRRNLERRDSRDTGDRGSRTVREPRLRSRGVGGVVGKLRRAKEEHDLGWQQSAANK
ncbi:unnamed protein product [Durusdinium trenchii]|uniref:C2H2-type domain-containing protein n=1 Tax=Durusdinium trenchii TaxID=1381693 RepID=A0ABP0NPQ8_9DINO